MRWRVESTPRGAALPGVVLLAMILPAIGSVEAAPAPQGHGVATAGDAQNAAADDGAQAAAEGEDQYEWLVDEETGQRYRIEKIQNLKDNYRWVDEDTIRYRYGVYFDVVDQDDEWLWVKIWPTAEKRAPRPQPEEKSEEEKAAELAQVAASYETDVATVDRLAFEDFGQGLPQSGQWRQGFDVADMNGDGHLDIVFGPARKARYSRPNIFLGDGNGGWRPWDEARFPRLGYDYGDAAAGDLNGDGHLDLVFGVHLRGLLAVVGDGRGGFSPWTDGIQFDMPGQGGAALSFSSRAVELHDWNGDGRLDILALGEGPKGRKTGPGGEIQGQIINTARGLVVYLNRGDGTWALGRATDNTLMSVQFGDDFALADFNRDGRLDVALASRMRNNKYILGVGGEEGLFTTAALDALRPRTFVGAVEAVDYDGDGVVELIVGYQSHDRDRVWRTGVDVFSADRDLNWERRSLFVSEGMRGIYSLATGDLDGDGHLDLATISGDAEVWVFLGDGEGFFVREESPEMPPAAAGCHGYALRLADVDADGRDEMIAGFAGEESGLPGIAAMHQPGCARGGSLRVWKAVAAGTPAAAPAAAGTPATAPAATSGR